MRRSIFCGLVAICSLFAGVAHAADHYEFDKSHTRILFFINHLGFSDMVGEFTDYDGSFTFDPTKPGESTVNVSLKPRGIRTSSSDLDSELQGKKFFNTKTFPEITFVSKSIAITGAQTGVVTGDLTLLGVTKPVKLNVHFNKADYHPFTQDFVAGFSATANFKRSDFGMTYLVPMVADELRLEIQTEGINLDRKKQDAIKH